MIIGIGVDTCDISRFADVANRASPLFYERLLSQTEHRYYQNIQNEDNKARWVASVFAAKEAVLKATGTGIDGRYGLNTINTFDAIGHCWQVCLPAPLLERLGESVQCHLALSYSKKVVIAFAILEK